MSIKNAIFGNKVLNAIIIVCLLILGYLGIQQLPSEYASESIVEYETVNSTETIHSVKFKILPEHQVLNNYPYGEVVKDLLDKRQVPYYEPAVKIIAKALQQYMVQDILARYNIDTSVLNITQREYDLYYSSEGQSYRDTLTNKLIIYKEE